MAYPTAICSYEEYRKKYRAEQMRQLFSETAHFFYDAPEKYGFEERQGQTEMALEIVAAINNTEHLAVEAGVGIGKSFAYLVPLLLYNTLFEEPVVVAASSEGSQEDETQTFPWLVIALGSGCGVLLLVCIIQGTVLRKKIRKLEEDRL